MIFSMLRQQLIGTINISFPFIIFYYVAPNVALSFAGIMLYSFAVAAYIGYMAYISTKNHAKELLYAPTEKHETQFVHDIMQCDLDPKHVSVRYAYTDDAIAMTFFNVIAVDPMIWNTVQDDPEAVKAQNIIQQYVLASISENKNVLHQNLKNILTPDAQKFIFKHELAHVFYQYSYKRIVVLGILAASATSIALILAHHIIPILGGLITLIVSIFVGLFIDVLLVCF